MAGNLNERVQKIWNDFENSNPEEIVNTLEQIKDHFKLNEVREYLGSKIQELSKADEQKKKELCHKLRPYFDWYLQGR